MWNTKMVLIASNTVEQWRDRWDIRGRRGGIDVEEDVENFGLSQDHLQVWRKKIMWQLGKI